MTTPMIPVNALVTGQNYRRRFDPAQMTELEESIRTQGLHTPITVRPMDDGKYQVIAGHRRLIAFSKVNGEDASIPVFVRMLSDPEAIAAMVAENKVRADTTAIEDAEAASRLLGTLNGDRDEAARRLGWNRQLLERRLALMNASQKVRDAYIDDKVQLGHVEILATMRQEVQDHVLGKVLESAAAGNAVPTVSEFKSLAERYLLNLDKAIFDKAQCGSCRHNTGATHGLFETSFEGTNCTNRECYDKKTEETLEAKAKALESEFQVVRIVRPGDNSTLVQLRVGGDKGVSQEQSINCKQCKDFGACISAVPDKLGAAYKNVCFDAACNAAKVKENQKSIAEAEKPKVNARKEVDPTQAGKSETTAAVKTEKQTGGQAKKPQPSEIKARPQIVEYREGTWRKILSKVCEKLPPEKAHAVLIGICLTQPARIDQSELRNKAEAIGMKAGLSTADTVASALERTTEENLQVVKLLGSALDSVTTITDVVALLKVLEADIARYWKLSEKFLTLLTKAEIEAICTELGIDQAMGKEYTKAKAGSKEDFVKAVSTVEGFNYVGAIPKIVRWN